MCFAGALSPVLGSRAFGVFHAQRLKRYYGQWHLRFITCSCYRRLPLLRSAHATNERERSKTAKPCAR